MGFFNRKKKVADLKTPGMAMKPCYTIKGLKLDYHGNPCKVTEVRAASGSSMIYLTFDYNPNLNGWYNTFALQNDKYVSVR